MRDERERAAYFAAYYRSNRERIRERRCIRYFADHEEAKRRLRESYRKHRDARRAEAREASKSRYADNPEKYADKKKRYKAANQERVRAQARSYAAKRKAIRLGATKGSDAYTAADVALTMRNQAAQCWWCGASLTSTGYHVDHRIPLSRGGDDTAANITLSCPSCNLRKFTKTPQEFCGRLL